MTLPYRLAVGALRLVAPVLASGDSKLARGMAGREATHQRLAEWGRRGRDPARPLVWFHAPSVGEGLQARAVIDALRAGVPDLQVVYTFFSPSAETFASRLDADVTDYLPWDLAGPCRQVLDAVGPDALVFTKTEVWPVLVEEAGRRGVPVAIVGATVPEGAGRMRWPARALLRPTWRRLQLACANSEPDASRLRALGVRDAALRVTGDPGIDSAAARFHAADPEAPYLAPFAADPRSTVVAGSTWPSDEDVLVPALRKVRSSVPKVRLVIAPHEPDASHVDPLIARLREGGWAVRTLSEVEAAGQVADADAVVVDRVGVLAHLYGVADASFVGGGFHDAGLHSVLEPAAAGSPVVFGPGHRNARAAGDLLSLGGAKLATDADTLADVLTTWLLDVAERNRTGGIGVAYIEGHRGAAARSAEHLVRLIEARS